MNHQGAKTYRNVCPRNCPSSCTMISHIENDSIHHIAGDINHPYTKGKLCAKGFSYAEKNNHRDRLAAPSKAPRRGYRESACVTMSSRNRAARLPDGNAASAASVHDLRAN